MRINHEIGEKIIINNAKEYTGTNDSVLVGVIETILIKTGKDKGVWYSITGCDKYFRDVDVVFYNAGYLELITNK